MEDLAAAPAEGAAPDVGKLLAETGKNLAALADAAAAGGMPPELAEGFAKVAEQFGALVEAASSGGDAAEQPPPRPETAGTVSAEAGGNPRARPMSMGG